MQFGSKSGFGTKPGLRNSEYRFDVARSFKFLKLFQSRPGPGYYESGDLLAPKGAGNAKPFLQSAERFDERAKLMMMGPSVRVSENYVEYSVSRIL